MEVSRGRDAHHCVQAGASIVHYHARGADGSRSMDPVPYSKAVEEALKRARGAGTPYPRHQETPMRRTRPFDVDRAEWVAGSRGVAGFV